MLDWQDGPGIWNFADGRDTVYTLLADLQATGKTDELPRVLSDRNYMEQLLAARWG